MNRLQYFTAMAALVAIAVPFYAPAQDNAAGAHGLRKVVRKISEDIITEGNTFSIPAGNHRVIVEVVSDDIIRVGASPSMQVLKFRDSRLASLKPQPVKVSTTVSPEQFTASTPKVTVVVDRLTGKVSFIDSNGKPLLAESDPLDNTDGRHSVSFGLKKSENIYGAGERGHASRLNGSTLTFYNRPNYGYGAGDARISQTGISIPYVASDAGYGILFDDSSPATLNVGETLTFDSEGEYPLSYYFINGNGTLEGATSGYTLLTGRQDLPPAWTLGYITSKYGYHNREEALGAVDSLKTRGYPLDGIVFDLYWYGTETDMGRLEWDKKQFPDHRSMLDSLRRMGVNTVLIHQPYINKKGAIDNYNLLAGKGLLTKDADGKVNDVTTWVGEAGMFDMANPATREWLWERLSPLTAEGVAGWWGDLGEPEVHPLSIVHADGETASAYHNYYGNEWSKTIYEGMRRDFPDQRPMLMMRGGTAGLQRYSVFPWTGDVARSWEGLQAQVPLMLSSGLSGLGYMGSDVGGFAVNPENPTNEELYARWLEMGVFSPVLRTHAQLAPEPYHYPGISTLTLDYIRMRYQWFPYNYTLAYENAAKGWPLARPLNFHGDNPGEKYADLADEYLWGREVLVAPVMKAGATSREVLFPQGEWVSWWNPREHYSGGNSYTVAAPLERLPLFVKTGSFIPQYEEYIENLGKYNPQKLTIVYFPGSEESGYTLFDDNRLSPTSLADGQYRLTRFSATPGADSVAIDVRSEGGVYPGMPAWREFTLQVPALKRAPRSVTLSDDSPMKEAASPVEIGKNGWSYDPSSGTLSVKFQWDYEPLTVNITY